MGIIHTEGEENVLIEKVKRIVTAEINPWKLWQ